METEADALWHTDPGGTCWSVDMKHMNEWTHTEDDGSAYTHMWLFA